MSFSLGRDSKTTITTRFCFMVYHTVVSLDGSVYQRWQAQLLWYTHRQHSQSGPLTFLISSDQAVSLGIPTDLFQASVQSPHPVTRDHYPPYNKPAAYREYLAKGNYRDETWLLLDPDMIFTRFWMPQVKLGNPIGESIWYMNPRTHPGNQVIRRHCRRYPDRVQAVGFPVAIRSEDLRQFVDRWWNLTVELRQDRLTRQVVDWVCEMWAFTLAAAEVGIVFQEEQHAQYSNDDFPDRELVHYTYHTQGDHYLFDKRRYRPWSPLPPLSGGVKDGGRRLHQAMSEAGLFFRSVQG